MASIEVKQVLNSEIEKVWNALYNDYGNIYLHNPGIVKSNNLNDATKGALGVLRHCEFVDGMFVDEEITQVTENKNFTVTVTNSSYPPAIKKWYADYEIEALEDNKTEVKMTLHVETDPEMMANGMLEQMKEPLGYYLLGLGYHLETGTAITMENFPMIMQGLSKANS